MVARAHAQSDARFRGDLGGDEGYVDTLTGIDHHVIADLARFHTRLHCHGAPSAVERDAACIKEQPMDTKAAKPPHNKRGKAKKQHQPKARPQTAQVKIISVHDNEGRPRNPAKIERIQRRTKLNPNTVMPMIPRAQAQNRAIAALMREE
jgi:hypothetical protein